MAEKVILTGGDKLRARLLELSRNVSGASKVNVGFLGNSTEPGGANTAMVAAIQEFGAPAKGIPPRPFFRTMVAKEEGHWGDDLGALLKAHDYDAKKCLELMGDEISGELRDSIVELTSPELSDVTLLLRERFGNSPENITFADVQQARRDIAAGVKPQVTETQAKPLVWTGAMLDSIDKEVE